jgi:hypothetical protein
MAHLTAPLAAAQVAIFAISTWNTDFVLVHDEDRSRAVDALRTVGWTVDDLRYIHSLLCLSELTECTSVQYKLPLI